MEKKVTRHGEKRIRERIGVSKKGAERQAEMALERGLSHGQMKGSLHKWVTSVAMKEYRRGQYYIYNNKLFIYKSSLLITVIPVPSNLHKSVAEQNKKKKVI